MVQLCFIVNQPRILQAPGLADKWAGIRDILERPDVVEKGGVDPNDEAAIPHDDDRYDSEEDTAVSRYNPLEEPLKIFETIDDMEFEAPEVEDITAEEYPEMDPRTTRNLPTFQEMADKVRADEIDREFHAKLAEVDSQADTEKGKVELEEGEIPEEEFPYSEFERIFEETCRKRKWRLPETAKPLPDYVEAFMASHRDCSGRIIAWGWFDKIKAFAVKREFGVEYYKDTSGLCSMPYFDWMTMARLKMLNPDNKYHAEYFEIKLRRGFRVSWKRDKLKTGDIDFVYSPQFAKRFKKRVNPVTNQVTNISVWKPANKMKLGPIMKIEQDFHDRFIGWFYDGETHEAVIVLKTSETYSKGRVDQIRLFDPYWISNMSKEDIRLLSTTRIAAQPHHRQQADYYEIVAKTCFVEDIHA